MPRERRARRPTGGHTPVSNLPAEEAGARRRVIQRPSEGVNPRTPAPNADGTEAVARRAAREAAPERLWTPPASGALRDIAEASFGPPPPARETVHGPDDRIKITKTDVYPWRAHASLLITAADNSMWIGTGWFIGPHTLITAGHVVHIKSGVPGQDGWVKSINVMSGRSSSRLPYGSVTSTEFHSVTGWTEDGDQNYDYGAIIIPKPLGDVVGVFGFGIFSDADLRGAIANIAGYPGDKPAGTLWYDHQRVASVSSRKVYYDIDTMGGQSGSAVYRFVGSNRVAIAVHAYGGATTNSGTRINRSVYDNMLGWKR